MNTQSFCTTGMQTGERRHDYPKYTGVRLELGKDVYVKIHIPAKITIELNDELKFIVDEADKIKGI